MIVSAADARSRFRRIREFSNITPAVQKLSRERASLHTETTRSTALIERREDKRKQLATRHAATQRRIKEQRAHRTELESRRHIFRHDVELDSIFGLLKVGFVLLVTYVLKEYLGGASMEPVTFLERFATLPGRLRTTSQLEIVTFECNHRDPEMMALLETHVEAINGLRLPTRAGRVLRIAVDPAPVPRRPPPPGSRVKTERRFAK